MGPLRLLIHISVFICRYATFFSLFPFSQMLYFFPLYLTSTTLLFALSLFFSHHPGCLSYRIQSFVFIYSDIFVVDILEEWLHLQLVSYWNAVAIVGGAKNSTKSRNKFQNRSDHAESEMFAFQTKKICDEVESGKKNRNTTIRIKRLIACLLSMAKFFGREVTIKNRLRLDYRRISL